MPSFTLSRSARHETVVLATKTLNSGSLTPQAAYLGLSGRDSILFESTGPDNRLATFSIIAFDPKETISISGDIATIACPKQGTSFKTSFQCPLELLSQRLETIQVEQTGLLSHLPFTCGLAGYMAYSAISYFEPVSRHSLDFSVPEIRFGLYDCSVVFDHLARKIHIMSARGQEHLEEIEERILSCEPLLPLKLPERHVMDESKIESVFDSSMTQEAFEDRVRQSINLIKEGELAQIVLSRRFTRRHKVNPKLLYRYLQATNPSPYSYLLEYENYSYVGSSPETLVSFDGQTALTRALAGTRPAGAGKEQDELMAKDLKDNEKEMAEHLMLVDLARNDLGRVCIPGTVVTGTIAEVVNFSQVMHLATLVKGDVENNLTAFDVTRACFPAGTVSGAPKVRAMQHLHHLEPESRCIYSGLVGYFDVSGKAELAIAIRSALVKEDACHVNAGAGIVFDSDPGSEFNETRHKARAVLAAIELAIAAEERESA